MAASSGPLGDACDDNVMSIRFIARVTLIGICMAYPVIAQNISNSTSTSTTTLGTTSLSTSTPDLGSATVFPLDSSRVLFCTCDLTHGACDVNCCCDNDCSAADRSAFSICTELLYDFYTGYCMRQDVLYTQNVPYLTNISSANLFCIQTDNYQASNYYTSPLVATNTSTFSSYESRYASYSYAPNQDTATAANLLGSLYKSGDPIITVFANNLTGYLNIPQNSVTNECEDYKPAAFWIDQTTSCARYLTGDLSMACQSSAYLNINAFYNQFRIATRTNVASLSDPQQVFDNSSMVSISLGRVVCYDQNSLPINCSSLGTASSTTNATTSSAANSTKSNTTSVATATLLALAPHYNNTLCLNGVTEVTYDVTLAASTMQIEAVVASFTLRHLRASSFPLVQTYSITFHKEQEVNIFKRSGNPGYLLDQPVLAGVLRAMSGTQPMQYHIALNGARSNYLTMVTGTSDGSCAVDSANRTPVLFGTNMRSGCALKVTYENITSSGICNKTYYSIKQALLGDTLSLTETIYIATFGNSSTIVTGDWVPILIPQPPSEPPSTAVNGVCQSMLLSMHLEILYANVGSLENPQAKIIGAQLSFVTNQQIKYKCSGPYCLDSIAAAALQQTFEVSSSVAFVDVSSSPAAAIAEQPIVSAKLPYDFFYPFYLPSSSPQSCGQPYRAFLLCIAILLAVLPLD